MGYENPLLRLPAGQALRRLPKADRARIEAVMREFMQAFADRHQGGLQPDMFAAPAARKPRQSTKRKAI